MGFEFEDKDEEEEKEYGEEQEEDGQDDADRFEFDVQSNGKLFRKVKVEKKVNRKKKVKISQNILNKNIHLSPGDQDTLLDNMLVKQRP